MVKMSQPDVAIIKASRNAGKKMSPRELGQATGMNYSLAYQTVRALVRAGYMERAGGRFRLTKAGKEVVL